MFIHTSVDLYHISNNPGISISIFCTCGDSVVDMFCSATAEFAAVAVFTVSSAAVEFVRVTFSAVPFAAVEFAEVAVSTVSFATVDFAGVAIFSVPFAAVDFAEVAVSKNMLLGTCSVGGGGSVFTERDLQSLQIVEFVLLPFATDINSQSSNEIGPPLIAALVGTFATQWESADKKHKSTAADIV